MREEKESDEDRGKTVRGRKRGKKERKERATMGHKTIKTARRREKRGQ